MTLGPTIDANGISIPTYETILSSLKDQYRSIYGSDVVLDDDSQDGQWVSIQAASINDANMACVATYNQFSPATAQGAGLSSVVKINGLARHVATNSTVDLVIVGTAGTTLNNAQAGDALGQKWAIPSTTIPGGGTITVTATATDIGALSAGANTVNRILTPTLGWQTVTNPLAATPGAPVESDAALRQRQAQSTASSAVTPMEAFAGAVANLDGVIQIMPYENDSESYDANGLPPHSISLVVKGGDSQQIATTIAVKKTPGATTVGTTAVVVTDSFGVDHTLRFYRPTPVNVQVQITLKALTGYTTAISNQIKAAVANYIEALPIGAIVALSRVGVPAALFNGPGSETFDILPGGILIGKNGGSKYAADLAIAFNEDAGCIVTDVTIVVV